MILAEERLEELFKIQPTVKDFDSVNRQPYFGFGTHKDLLNVLAINRKSKVYPLIWLDTTFFQKGDDNKPNMRLKFVLATISNSELTNSQRLQTTFKYTLVPLYNNVITAMQQSGFIEFRNKASNLFSKKYNYGNKDDKEHQTPDIWDAIVFEREIEMNDCLMKTINY